ncbi:beta/gamma crystallin domain-containing protein [Streptomyces sp. HD]|uniref:beta/gamma crystallin domain-containing protein n=1 Tax=Streptomyces sp. HD TaxID=3020892 RepID=UPI00232E324E|nr:beta/gamma crystallin domain-containing protein [Streptomyces sp. HD]MDC0769510.1 beta/gamma crystallin domain-containing protein [Streptomyces sp. HD]
MKHIAKRAVLAATTTFALAASLTVVSATEAFAINTVPCGRTDFLKIRVDTTDSDGAYDWCLANAGTVDMSGAHMWLERIETGNNRVQWYGDGKWQPATPIGKNTVYTFPNHPGGVRMDKIRIL